ncbi:ABC transporter ATP-binding protein [Limoniibacter endophyticus]|uniref:Iron ABC transporter ATP-binding protein n=1 Tax=Limoniibacter endophyticus TaxID=1565040 RepID=A0A8J3DGI3_9HYPH|nr:ATP-binding cassette domain-containing protein [Limoniibacter endophyticus]GHC64054.1 iron ABC transporter ATP-binding protein [Limoniibacter endophyticus]
MIEAKALSKTYGNTLVVDSVDLTLPAGGITAIVGPNGAGKSTFLSMISRLMPMTAGTVTIAGMDVTRTPGDKLARHISILRQDNQVLSRLSVRDLIAFGRYPYSKGHLTKEDGKHIEEALRWLDLEPLADRFIDELSGGQRQRAFIAMVLCQNTDYILLDEPLNNLDMRHAVGMMKMLRNAADSLNKTIILVLHDINFASAYADRIVAMKDGKLAHVGTAAEIICPEVLAAIYGVDTTVHELDGKRIVNYF